MNARSRSITWVPTAEGVWVAAYRGRFFRAYQRPTDSSPDAGTFIVTETGVAGVPIRQLAEDAASWKVVNDVVVSA